MSCCGGDFCQFEFPPGPPLLDVPVSHLGAKYLFLPYGSLLEVGEKVRIWMENGRTETVFVGDKWPVDFSSTPPRILAEAPPTWEQVALDSGLEPDTLLHWRDNPLFNPQAPACVMRFEHIAVPRPTLWQRWQRLLARVRNL
ncbi:hypothetical protein [Sulfurivirga sp.]|uniref:hypothetical protein n=1 Tax=Sulfurivirga sp. TaxID=2614236 RepID=UPI0025F512D2|nr:hypothetical protein [Sulfurivirga sp.]